VNWQSTRMPPTEEESKRELADAEAAFQQAMSTDDINKISALTVEDFVWTHGAVQMNRKQLLEELGSGRLKFEKPTSAKSTISLYGETAIVRGEWPSQKPARYTLTFINQGGAWKAVAMHSTI